MRTRRSEAEGVKLELRRACISPSRNSDAYVRAVVSGHVQYYGVPMNYPPLYAFVGP